MIRVKWFGRHKTIIRLKTKGGIPHLGKGVLIDSFVRYIPSQRHFQEHHILDYYKINFYN